MREIGSAALSAVRRDVGGMCGGEDSKVDTLVTKGDTGRMDHPGNGYF